MLSFDNKKKRENVQVCLYGLYGGGTMMVVTKSQYSVRRVATKGISQVVTYHTAGKSRDGIQFHISKSDV